MTSVDASPVRWWHKAAAKLSRRLDKWSHASISVMEGAGQMGAKHRPFSYEAAVRRFHGWCYAAAMLNAQAVAAVPLRLYVRKRGGAKLLYATRKVGRARKAYLLGDTIRQPSPSVRQKLGAFGEDFEEVAENHPLLELLRAGNEWWNSFDLTTLRVLFQELTGNAYLHPVLGPLRAPVALWPMPAQWVEIVPSREEFIKGYVYGKDSQTRALFEPDEVIHFRRPNPGNLYYGLGKVEAGWGALSLDSSAHEMDLAFSDNCARPDYAVIVKSGAVEPALDRMEKKLASLLRGRHNTGRHLVVTGDVQLTPLNFPPKDLNGREDIVEEIASVFGVPVSMLKANDPNLASAKAAYQWWREATIAPLCRMDEEVLNAKLLPMFGIEDDAVLAYDNPVPSDEVFEHRSMVENVNAGIITRNEARTADGWEPMDDEMADALLVNGQPLGAQPQQPPAYGQGGTFMVPGLSYRPPVRKDAPVGDADDHAREDQPEAPEVRMAAALARMLAQMEAEVFRWLAARKSAKSPRDDLNALLDRYSKQIEDAVRTPMTQLLSAGGTGGIDKIVVALGQIEPDNPLLLSGFDVSNPEVERFMREYTVRLAGNVVQSTAEAVSQSLAEGFGQGESLQQLRDRLTEGGQFSAGRAEVIARTEAARAYTAGEQEAWRQSGVVTGRKWLLSANACEFCRAIAAQYAEKAVPLGTPFFPRGSTVAGVEGGVMRVDYGDMDGPPAHPNCRCTLIAELDEE